jgi:hypothetical protein
MDFIKEKKERYTFRTGTDLWYRYYINYDELSQTRLNVYGDYTRFLGNKLQMGLLYNFRWSDRVGTSVTGDLLMRSFKYLGNEGTFYLDLLPSDATFMRLFTSYQYKIYYDESTLDPLDHGNLEVNYSFRYEKSREHGFILELSLLDRNYSQYHALDSSGHYDRTHPLRHFRYYAAGIDYDWKPVRGLRINPELGVRRRIDMFEGYYSYFSYGGGMRIRYMWNDLYVSLYGAYRRTEYDIRKAFTSETVDPMLVYGYLDLAFTMKYDIGKRWEIYLKLEQDNRDSNSNLDYFKTRRSYENYQAVLGINYSLPDMKWQ